MNKTVIFLTLVTLLSLTPSLTHAQGRKPLQVNNTEKNVQVLDEVQSQKAQRVQEQVARIISKLDQRVLKYEEFLEKIRTRRSELSGDNLDTTELDRLIRVAEADLIQAKADLNESKSKLENLDYTKTIRELRSEILAEVANSRAIFKVLHQSVIAVVTEFGSLSTTQE